MRLPLPLACLAALAACSSDEPERPSKADEERFEQIDAMLDEEGAKEEGAASEDAAPSE
ncbi:hypothetical protein [Sphingomicrobium clamense]|uniref:Secreted protein n=1 Tax=Sphingomicrobium clamense TaxID=2851013 RepID=A0ABS6V4M2_9SPHN|nr:hypothetical protein [Sphingomicrobium sp. B8]MBW0144446.1 hypothetical protein [Sphingomicrobium sp. B8]